MAQSGEVKDREGVSSFQFRQSLPQAALSTRPFVTGSAET